MSGAETLTVDPIKMMNRKRKVVETLVGGVGALVSSNGIEVASGTGQLLAPGKVRVQPADGAPQDYEARNVILANGSKPSVPPFFDIDGRFVQTTDEALDTEDLPEDLIIIGGGVIGIEMATIFLNLGVKVSILELLPDILLTEDLEVRKTMRRQLKKSRAKLYLEAKAKNVRLVGERVVVNFEDDKGKDQTLEADRMLVATGRSPVLDGIDTQALGLETDGPYIKADRHLKTNLPNVYAIGDLIGGMMLAHKASAEAEVAVETILGGKRNEVRPEYIPRCIWGLAEIGAVGLSEEEARASGRSVKVGKFPYGASGAAQAMGQYSWVH